jgi:hypothetical protein
MEFVIFANIFFRLLGCLPKSERQISKACSTHGIMKNSHELLVGTPEGKGSLVRG